jgi:glycine hydroxymethyltransferase
MIFKFMHLAEKDPILQQAIKAEGQRQKEHLELIASENYVSQAVLEAQGSLFTNKYAEGYPGRRYYQGCGPTDVVEELAIDRAKQLFKADYVNVQPHSGSQANAAVLLALMKPGECLMGMSLSDGGHLTHGSGVNFSGRLYRAVTYGVDPDSGVIDYDALQKLAEEHRPKVLIAGFSAYSRIIDWQRFRQIADSVGAYLFADIAHVAGLVATGHYPSPFPYAHVVTSTTHKTLRGPRGGIILAQGQSEAFMKTLNSAVFPGTQGGPLMHVIAAKAVAFGEALAPSFQHYQEQVLKNASALAAAFLKRDYALVSGGTDNHLLLVDLRSKQLTGRDADNRLERAGITVNRNTIPKDPQSPFVTSGIRLGTPALTTRGMKENEMEKIVAWIDMVLTDPSEAHISVVLKEVRDFASCYPVEF